MEQTPSASFMILPLSSIRLKSNEVPSLFCSAVFSCLLQYTSQRRITIRVHELGRRVSGKWLVFLDNCSYLAKFTMQFNVNWKGIPTYQDVLSNVYTYSSKCGNRTYTALYQQFILSPLTNSTPLNCTSLEDGKFDCVGNVESVWVRIWEAEQWQTIITHCGAKFGEKYQDVTYSLYSFVSLLGRILA